MWRGEPGLSGAGAESSPGIRRFPRGAWAPNSDRRDVRGPKPVHRRVLPRGELAGAGANPWLCPQARHAGHLGSSRPAQGGAGLSVGARRARAVCAASTTGPTGKAKATRGPGPRAGCEACGSVFAPCPSSAARAGGATRWPPSWPSRWPPSSPGTTAPLRSASSLKG